MKLHDLAVVVPDQLTAQRVSEVLSALSSTMPSSWKLEEPQTISLEQSTQLGLVVRYCDQVLIPAASAQTMETISRLFNHYPSNTNTQGLPEEAARILMKQRKQLTEDWLEDVQEYPAWVLKEACKLWRQGPKGKFKPTPSDIRALCADALAPVISAKAQAVRVERTTRRRAEMEAHAAAERAKLWGPVLGRDENKSGTIL